MTHCPKGEWIIEAIGKKKKKKYERENEEVEELNRLTKHTRDRDYTNHETMESLYQKSNPQRTPYQESSTSTYQGHI